MSEPVGHVGFIGLGRMGAAIARNIMKAGFTLTVYNRTAAKMQPFLDAGAAGAASPAEAAADADVVVTSLMDDQSVLDTVEGGDGILRGLRRGAVHVGTTTISPRCARTLAALHAAHGSDYVSAPVVGRPDVAEAGQLISFVAGDAGAIARCQAVVSAYSRAVLPVGATPAVANSLKLAVNYLLSAVVDLMGQVFAFGEKSGIERQHLDMVMQTMFSHPGCRSTPPACASDDTTTSGSTCWAGSRTCSSSSTRRPRPASRSRLRTSSATRRSRPLRTVSAQRT